MLRKRIMAGKAVQISREEGLLLDRMAIASTTKNATFEKRPMEESLPSLRMSGVTFWEKEEHIKSNDLSSVLYFLSLAAAPDTGHGFAARAS